MTIQDILDKKRKSQKITVLTVYDYATGVFLDQAGVDIALVGDSLANVVLGLGTTKEVGMPHMLHHAGAVVRAVKNALVVGDMPYDAYQPHPQDALTNARRFIELGCGAVKLEWFDGCCAVVRRIVDAGIAVMGHVGLTPQTIVDMKVQGKDADSAKVILEQARQLQEAGCFSVVLECVPRELARAITQALQIPTIGIGAGPDCDGQVLVSHDLLGLSPGRSSKFVKKYADVGSVMLAAFKQYKSDVESGKFPDDAHAFHMPEDELKKM